MSASSVAETAVPSRPNYILRHWRGDLPLGVAYWVNGALLGNLIPLVLFGVVAIPETAEGGTLQGVAILSLLALSVSVLLPFWSVVGIWRSAEHHPSRGGSRAWASAAQFAVILGLLSLFGNWSKDNLLGVSFELMKIAAGQDDLGVIEASVAPNGKSLLLRGTLGRGSYDRVKTVLGAAPHIRVVELDSLGGRLFEADRIAKEVQKRGLNTYVTGSCVSACTMIFLAGKDRGATPNAKIGFHSASLAGVSGAGDDAMIDSYRRAGISHEFIRRVRATPTSDLWYPSRDELSANGVTTRLSLGGETSLNLAAAGLMSAGDLRKLLAGQPLWQAIEVRYPGSMNRAAEAAWKVHESGGSEGEVLTAARDVLSDLMPKALKVAPPEVLLPFLKLFILELTESLKVSPEACKALLDGRLNIPATLPKHVVEEDSAFTLLLFQTRPSSAKPLNADAAATVLRSALAKLTPQELEIVTQPESARASDRDRCLALLTFYKHVNALPPRERITTLRLLFQS